MAYIDLASVKGIVDQQAHEVLQSAERLLIGQGYKVLQRSKISVVANRQKESGLLKSETVSLAVMVEEESGGGVKVKVRGDDQEGVQANQSSWKAWADSLPRKTSPEKQRTVSEQTTKKPRLQRPREEQRPSDRDKAAELRKQIASLQNELRDLVGEDDAPTQIQRISQINAEDDAPSINDVSITPPDNLAKLVDVSKAHTPIDERAETEPPKKCIEAQEFRLVDDRGRLRSVLNTGDGGHTSFALLDEDGTIRTVISASTDGTNVVLTDNEGNVRSRLGVGEKGPALDLLDSRSTLRSRLTVDDEGPSLILIDEDEIPRATLKEDDEGRFLLGLLDPNGGTRTTLHVESDGDPRLVLRDSNGTIRSIFTVSDDEGSTLGLFDRWGDIKASIMVGDDGSPMIAICERGVPRALLSIPDNGRPALTFTDEFGNLTQRIN